MGMSLYSTSFISLIQNLRADALVRRRKERAPRPGQESQLRTATFERANEVGGSSGAGVAICLIRRGAFVRHLEKGV